jgi:hypothetical protein
MLTPFHNKSIAPDSSRIFPLQRGFVRSDFLKPLFGFPVIRCSARNFNHRKLRQQMVVGNTFSYHPDEVSQFEQQGNRQCPDRGRNATITADSNAPIFSDVKRASAS